MSQLWNIFGQISCFGTFLSVLYGEKNNAAVLRCSNQQDKDQKYLSLNFEIKSVTKDIVNTELITSHLDLGLSRSGNGLGRD